jgi:hypothetical protein
LWLLVEAEVVDVNPEVLREAAVLVASVLEQGFLLRLVLLIPLQ